MRRDANLWRWKSVRAVFMLAAAFLVLGCPVEARDFAKSPAGDDGGSGADSTGGGCGTNGVCCSAATCTPTSPCLMDDPSHCGACGHDCLGGSCSNGKCQPVQIASTVSRATALAVSESTLFWTEETGLKSCPKTGCTGAPNVLSTDSGATGALSFDSASGNLFFASCCGSFLDSYSSTGNRLSHTRVTSQVGTIAVDASYLFWNDGTTIVRATRDGSSPTIIATGIPGTVRSFASDARAGAIYAACTGNQGAVIRAPIESSASDASLPNAWTAVAKLPNPSSIAIANGNVYFAVQGTSPGFNDGGVYLCPLNGCTQPTALLTGHRATAVITAATNLYFIINESIYTCPLAGCGGSPTLLFANSANTSDGLVLAQDPTALYWIPADGSVMKLAK